MQVHFIDKPAFKVIGFRYEGKNGDGQIAEHWGRFQSRFDEIPNIVKPDTFYGLCEYAGGDTAEDWFIRYLACREVSSLEHIPEGMAGREIPAKRYAVFTHIGPVTTLMDSFRYVSRVWLPDSGYELEARDEFEFYDDRFTGPWEEDSRIDLYFPLKV